MSACIIWTGVRDRDGYGITGHRPNSQMEVPLLQSPISDSANLTVKATDDGFLITADARRPAPEFRSILYNLAHPCPYGGSKNMAYRRALDTVQVAFGGTADFAAPHWDGSAKEVERLEAIIRIRADMNAAVIL